MCVVSVTNLSPIGLLFCFENGSPYLPSLVLNLCLTVLLTLASCIDEYTGIHHPGWSSSIGILVSLNAFLLSHSNL